MSKLETSDFAIIMAGITLIASVGVGLWLCLTSSETPHSLKNHPPALVKKIAPPSLPNSVKTFPTPPHIAAQPLIHNVQNSAIKTEMPTQHITASKGVSTQQTQNIPQSQAHTLPPKIEKKADIDQILKKLSLGKTMSGEEVTAVIAAHHRAHCQEKAIACQEIELSFLPMKQSFELWQEISDAAISADMIEVKPVFLEKGSTLGQLVLLGKLNKNIMGFFWYGAEEGKEKEEWHLMPISESHKQHIPEIIPASASFGPVLRMRDSEFAEVFAPAHSEQEAENFAPLKLLKFEKGHFTPVWDRNYQPFFLQDLMDHMPLEQGKKLLLSNEWLAYYVHTLTMMGYFPQAWAYMLLHRDTQDKEFVKLLKNRLLQEGLISEKESQEVPLHYGHLSKTERKKFKAEKALFEMFPSSEKKMLLQRLND